MVLLLLHGDGWDEFLLMGGAVALAFLIVKLTMRNQGEDEEPTETADSDGQLDSPVADLRSSSRLEQRTEAPTGTASGLDQDG